MNISFTEFNITRTSDNPLISQLLINNVTTEINGSTIYCSEDGDETNSPMTAINIPSKDKTWPFHAILIMLFHNIIYYIIVVNIQSEFKSRHGLEIKLFSSFHFSITCLQHLPYQAYIVYTAAVL